MSCKAPCAPYSPPQAPAQDPAAPRVGSCLADPPLQGTASPSRAARKPFREGQLEHGSRRGKQLTWWIWLSRCVSHTSLPSAVKAARLPRASAATSSSRPSLSTSATATCACGNTIPARDAGHGGWVGYSGPGTWRVQAHLMLPSEVLELAAACASCPPLPFLHAALLNKDAASRPGPFALAPAPPVCRPSAGGSPCGWRRSSPAHTGSPAARGRRTPDTRAWETLSCCLTASREE